MVYMAKIVHSEAAPSEAVHYSFAGVEFDLGGSKKKSYETNDPTILSNAEAHPWLSVDYGSVVVFGAPEDAPAPAADDFSYNDPKVAEAAEAAKREAGEAYVPVAIEAGKDQDKPVVTEGIAETLAAADDSDTKGSK